MKLLSSFTGRYLRPRWKRGSSFIFRARTCLRVHSVDSADHVSGERFLVAKPIDNAVFKPYGQVRQNHASLFLSLRWTLKILSWEEDGKPYGAQVS